jgi:hypothetical protein
MPSSNVGNEFDVRKELEALKIHLEYFYSPGVKQLNASPQDNASYKGVEKTWNS